MQINNASRQTVIHLRFIALKYRKAAYRLAGTRIGAGQRFFYGRLGQAHRHWGRDGDSPERRKRAGAGGRTAAEKTGGGRARATRGGRDRRRHRRRGAPDDRLPTVRLRAARRQPPDGLGTDLLSDGSFPPTQPWSSVPPRAACRAVEAIRNGAQDYLQKPSTPACCQ